MSSVAIGSLAQKVASAFQPHTSRPRIAHNFIPY